MAAPPLNPEDDPEYQAYLAQFAFGTEQANADAELRRTQAQLAYEQALEDMQQQGLASKRDIDTSLLGRGVYQSGERTVRDTDLQTALGQGRSRADQAFASQVGGVDADLQRALGQYGVEKERQAAMSRTRLADDQRLAAGGGGGGGGRASGGAAPAAPAPTYRPPAQAPNSVYTDYIDPYRSPKPTAPPKPPTAAKPLKPKPKVGGGGMRYM